MQARPTLIILAALPGLRERVDLGQEPDADTAQNLAFIGGMLRSVVGSHMPVVVVASAEHAHWVSQWVSPNALVTLPTQSTPQTPERRMGEAVAAGVLASAHAPGWLLMPAHMPLPQPETLDTVADAIGSHPVVYARYGLQRGYPVGFSSEFFSELIRLESHSGLDRLIARYPSHGLDTNDPGVVGRQ
jgi:molybdenum cofactor cytidylyltransferase